ncbi:MAG: alcohol dehydrogenase catalytic domain-containing protein [Pseudomonadota bacterium]
MKALVYTGANTLVYRDEPAPIQREASDSIVKVEACGICGSDMHAYVGHDERRPPPQILGHEAAGVVVEGPLAGKRVTLNPLITCMVCDHCLSGRSNLCAKREILSMMPRPGAFAEHVAIPSRNLVEIPDDMSFALAAMTEPMAVSYHAVNLAERALALPLSHARTVVIGGGAIGLCAAHVVASRGGQAIEIAETSAARRAMIERDAGFAAYDPQRGGPGESSVDLVIDAYGGPGSRAAASALARPGGAIIHIGLANGDGGLDIRKCTLQEIAFIGTYTYTMTEFRQALAGLADGSLGPITWSEERPLSEGGDAFAALAAGEVDRAKVVLRM